MNSKLLIGIGFVVVACLAFFGGSSIHGNNASFGASTSTYNTALQQLALYNWMVDVVNSLSATRAPQASVDVYASSSFTFATLANTMSATSTLTSSTAGSVTLGTQGDPVVGDMVLVGTNATSTAVKGVAFTGQVVSTGTILVTANQTATSSVAAAWAGGNVGINVIVFPKNGFIAPASLSVTTTSAPYNP